jgi:hypothetical protein
MNAIYFDMLDVKDEIKSFVNIQRFGDLYYKKMTLWDHSKSILRQNNVDILYRITNEKELTQAIEKVAYSESNEFILLSSNLAIINRESFGHFLKKIKYVDSSLAVCGCDCVKPFVKLSKKEMVSMLHSIRNNDYDLYKALEQKSEEVEKFSQETFYHEIKTYPDFVTYLQSNFELRYFNSIQSTRNIITKRSEQKEKMKKEFSFYSVLPDEMKIFFLPPFNFKEHAEYAEYSLERLHILDVSVQWIHLSINKEEFEKLLHRLFDFIHSRKELNVPVEKIKAIADNLYLEKLDERIKVFKETQLYKYVNDVVANSTSYSCFDDIINKYKTLYQKNSNERSYRSLPALGHGDLCFSNILYDKRIDFIKLIDPKGCVKESEGYMDAYYDLAKLSHSILGCYDFINNGIFEIKYDNQLQVYLEIPQQASLVDKQELFKKYLKDQQYPYRQVRLYEASLFLSMLPLHIDYPKKVLAFVLTAVQILEELENEKSGLVKR